MQHEEQLSELRHEFSARLASKLEEKRVGMHEAGHVVLAFRKILESNANKEEIRKFVEGI